jgi:hypothetical protein
VSSSLTSEMSSALFTLPGVDSYMLVAAAVFDVKSIAELRFVGELVTLFRVVRDVERCKDISDR